MNFINCATAPSIKRIVGEERWDSGDERKSRLIVSLLVTAMTFSLMSIGLTLSAYAVERDEQTAEENYVEDIEIYTAASATETLRDYEFSQAQTEYNIVFPDSRAGTAPFVVHKYQKSIRLHQKLMQSCIANLSLTEKS